MKHQYLKQSSSEKLILFFNGWAMDAAVVEHLKADDFDICMFYDYNEEYCISSHLLEDFAAYKELHLIAWSMGVWAAAKSLEKAGLDITSSLAINGTAKAIDDLEGIPKAIFKGTIDHFSERNLRKFQRRMFASKVDYDWFVERPVARNIDNQLLELKSIYKAYKDEVIIFNFAKVIIGQDDLIFPYKNQQHFWKDHSNVEVLKIGHFPFHAFETWAHLLNI